MKNFKSILKKVILISIIMLGIFDGVGGLSSPINIENNVIGLQFENVELSRKIIELEKKIKKRDSISQVLGINFNSEEFQNNDNILYYPTISPIHTRDFICLSSPYGWRKHPIEKKMLFHEGVDIAANIGSKVYSTAQGRVVKILYSKYGYGNRIVIKHAYGFETLYAHLDVIYVKINQKIKKNQLIGTVGSTGKSTGPHLHYEIRRYNELHNPLKYFYTIISEELLAKN